MSQPKTILVVDDEPDLCEIVCFHLNEHGYQTLSATNGVDAFKIVQSQTIDLIISDIQMPGGDGIELLDNVKNRNPETPVFLFITAYSNLTPEDAYDRGAEALFEKPINYKALHKTIEQAFLSKDLKWSQTPERFEVNMEIEIHLPHLNTSRVAKAINIARGGMFIAYEDILPKVEDQIEFNVSFQSGDLHQIAGNGIVRWVRPHQGEQRPRGFGLEFSSLDDNSRRQLIALIESEKSKAFIPKF